jgi:hypothetical protein
MSEGEVRYRLADGPETEVSVRVAAPAAALWPHVCDINFSARFSPEFHSAEWLDGAGEPSVGARFRGTNEHPAVGRWQVDCVVTEFEPGRRIGWDVVGPDGAAASWRFTLDDDPDADAGEQATIVTQWCRLGPGPSGLTPAIERMPDREHDIIARRLAEHRTNMSANLAGLADLAGG